MAYYNELKKYGTQTAIIDMNGNQMTYKEMDLCCHQFGERLESRKLVFSFCENSIGSICGYVAFLYNRVVPVLLDKHIDRELRKNLISIYQPDYIYVPNEIAKEIEQDNLELVCIYNNYGYCLYKTSFHINITYIMN